MVVVVKSEKSRGASFIHTQKKGGWGVRHSAPHHSHLGSLAGLTFGANTHTAPTPRLDRALASVPMALPTAPHRALSKAAPNAMGAGKEVGQPVELGAGLDRHPVAGPWRASPLCILGTPRRGMAGTLVSMAAASSSGVMRPTKSATRVARGREGLQ